jgi:Domain of unknown function (DUF4288)
MKKYSFKLLFEYLVGKRLKARSFRFVESRIVIISSKSSNRAFSEADRLGKISEFNYINDDGDKVCFIYIGITDFIEHGIESEENEVWYDIGKMLNPYENRHKFVITDHRSAIKMRKDRTSHARIKRNPAPH